MNLQKLEGIKEFYEMILGLYGNKDAWVLRELFCDAFNVKWCEHCEGFGWACEYDDVSGDCRACAEEFREMMYDRNMEEQFLERGK